MQRTREYKLHYSEVRGDVLRPPHYTNTSYNDVEKILKGIILESKEHIQKNKRSLCVSWSP